MLGLNRLGEPVSRLLAFLFLLAVFGLAVTEVHSFDIFWQLQSGRYLLETGRFIHTDLFTLASDVPRFEHCWLHDVLLYLFWKFGGAAGISWLKGGLLTLTVGFLAATARLRGASWWSLACCLPFVSLTTGGWLARPQLWTFLFFAFFLWLAERHCLQPSSRIYLWMLPALIVWANLHAGSVLAPALLLAYIVGTLPLLRNADAADWKRFRPFALLAGFCLLVPMATPYPLEWYQTLLRVASFGGHEGAPTTQQFNMDWRLTTFAAEPWFFYCLAGVGLLLISAWRSLKLRDICLLAGLGLMGWRLSRHTSFFYFELLAVMPIYLDTTIARLKATAHPLLKTVIQAVLLVLAIYGGVLFSAPARQGHGFFKPGLRHWHYPEAATRFIRENNLPANIYNTYDWGGYLAFRLYPDYLVFWDGRQDSPEMFDLGWRVMAGKTDWQQILDRFQVKTIVTRCLTMDTGQRYPLLDRLEQSNDWALVYADDWSLVFVREDAVPAAWLAQHHLDKDRIWQTLYSEAQLSVAENRWRYKAWWEMARIDLRRRRYQDAERHLTKYLSRSPVIDPVAERTLRMLAGLRGGQK